MLDQRERQRRFRIAALAGMTGFVLVSVMMLIMTPTPHDAVDSQHHLMPIAQIAVPSGLLTMSLTYFLVRRQK